MGRVIDVDLKRRYAVFELDMVPIMFVNGRSIVPMILLDGDAAVDRRELPCRGDRNPSTCLQMAERGAAHVFRPSAGSARCWVREQVQGPGPAQ